MKVEMIAIQLLCVSQFGTTYVKTVGINCGRVDLQCTFFFLLSTAVIRLLCICTGMIKENGGIMFGSNLGHSMHERPKSHSFACLLVL